MDVWNPEQTNSSFMTTKHRTWHASTEFKDKQQQCSMLFVAGSLDKVGHISEKLGTHKSGEIDGYSLYKRVNRYWDLPCFGYVRVKYEKEDIQSNLFTKNKETYVPHNMTLMDTDSFLKVFSKNITDIVQQMTTSLIKDYNLEKENSPDIRPNISKTICLNKDYARRDLCELHLLVSSYHFAAKKFNYEGEISPDNIRISIKYANPVFDKDNNEEIWDNTNYKYDGMGMIMSVSSFLKVVSDPDFQKFIEKIKKDYEAYKQSEDRKTFETAKQTQSIKRVRKQENPKPRKKNKVEEKESKEEEEEGEIREEENMKEKEEKEENKKKKIEKNMPIINEKKRKHDIEQEDEEDEEEEQESFLMKKKRIEK